MVYSDGVSNWHGKEKTGGVETERYISWWCTVMVLVTGMVKGKQEGLKLNGTSAGGLQ